MSDDFSVDWFSNNIPQIEARLNTPVNKGLEIGCYEGRSSCWFLQNEYFKNAELYFIDIWEADSLYNTFNDNISACKTKTQNIQVIRNTSDAALSDLLIRHKNSFDFIYVDGCHQPDQVYRDGCSSFQLLKSGGILIFDDYQIDYTNVPEYAHYGSPKAGVDQFLSEHDQDLEILLFDYQVMIRKL